MLSQSAISVLELQARKYHTLASQADEIVLLFKEK
jgi:hypothetical protein